MTYPFFQNILYEREQLWQQKQELVRKFKAPLVSISLRLPWEIRQEYPDIVREQAAIFLENIKKDIIKAHQEHNLDGPQYFALIRQESSFLKEKALTQEQTAVGALLDIDVLDILGNPITREALHLPPRTCFVCKRPAKLCAREQRHTLQEIRRHAERILYGTPESNIQGLGLLARMAVEDEARTLEKPGLVTPTTNGAHKDMNFDLLMRSSTSLVPYWEACAKLGYDYAGRSPKDLFHALRPVGQKAEQSMFTATGGVNTHKGMIFGLGLVCAGTGALWGEKTQKPTVEAILDRVQSMSHGLVRTELQNINHAGTAGENAFLTHGLTGARGEAEAGYPAVLHTALPLLQKNAQLSWAKAKIHALLGLMSVVQDTNIVRRGGYTALEPLQKASLTTLNLAPFTTSQGHEALRDLQKHCLHNRLSPGGCADMLAMACFFYRLQHNNESI